jgi:ADP-ribose pyrophosphatase YjhB (NUDIX family)
MDNNISNITKEDYDKLQWKEQSRKTVLTCKVFSIAESTSVSPTNKPYNFYLLESNPWAIVIPVLIIDGVKHFVMVKQWRHGAATMSIEFPGGVIEKNEDPAAGAARELLEETGRTCTEMVHLGTLSPNPAINTNQVYIYLALGLSPERSQNLDAEEYVSTLTISESEVLNNMGKEPYLHGLMVSAAGLYILNGGKK